VCSSDLSSDHPLVHAEDARGDARPGEFGRLGEPGGAHRLPPRRILDQPDRGLRPGCRIVFGDEYRFAAAAHQLPEPGDVRYHDRGAARHRLDERDAERGTRCGAEVQVGAAVVLGALALHAAGDAGGGPEPPGTPRVDAEPRAVTYDGDARPPMPAQDAAPPPQPRTQPTTRP